MSARTRIKKSAPLSRDALLSVGSNLLHRHHLQRLTSALGGSGLNRFHIHAADSLLSSASLLASYVKNRLVRNMETVSGPVVRQILELADMKNILWKHSTSQEARGVQLNQVLQRMQHQEQILLIRNQFTPCRKQLDELGAEIYKTQLALNYLKESVAGVMHPEILLSGPFATMTPSEIAALASPIAAVRGMLIRIRGPRKGNRGVAFQKSVGRISINSVNHVVKEECKMQLPSKLGIYGLYVRIVYCKKDRLVDCRSRIPVVDAEEPFYFKKIS